MISIAIIDLLGLVYDGDTLKSRGLGGSESAVILMSRELAAIGFDVTVYNNCKDSQAQPGSYNNVTFIDHSDFKDDVTYDIVISSRSVYPFFADNKYGALCQRAKYKVVWMHDTFCEGDEHIEEMLNAGIIDQLFTLSDFHTSYVLNCDHGIRRNFEVLKDKIFMTRNGANKWVDEVNLMDKKPHAFVYNASVTKGLQPLLDDIWPEIKKRLPDATLTVIGGYYRFRDGAPPDAQENVLVKYKDEYDPSLDVTFTGVIRQQEIGEILAKSEFMLYPTEFPETFGISTLESLLYQTPVITCNFGALEETAIDLACYKIDYANRPNGLFPNINPATQASKFINLVLQAVSDRYLYQQKQQYCRVVDDIASWHSVAMQWKQQFYFKLEKYLPVGEYRTVKRINEKVKRVYGRRFTNEVELQTYSSYGPQKRIVIISPYWNAKDYIDDHVASIDQQDYDNYLHIMIDDHSDDEHKKGFELTDKRIWIYNKEKKSCIENQLSAFKQFVKHDDIVILLDGDDFLVSNNSLFHFYNDMFSNGVEFTYGSCWSLADEIPLVAQDYPAIVKRERSYRKHHFNWKIPYTHLRAFSGKFVINQKIDPNKFRDEKGQFRTSGMDNPLFYEIIEQVPPEKIKAVKEIVCYYNDVNPLNDYKVNTLQQNVNASISYEEQPKELEKVTNILLAIPTNKYIEPETFKSIYDLIVPSNVKLHFEFFYGYQIDQIRNLIADWGKKYDYLFSVDSDIVLPQESLIRLLSANKDIVTGVYIQRKEEEKITELYREYGDGMTNIKADELQTGLHKVAGCGFGCVLVKSDVLRTMEYPHFEYHSALDHAFTISEDVDFCQKASKLGFEIWADMDLLCKHKGSRYFNV